MKHVNWKISSLRHLIIKIHQSIKNILFVVKDSKTFFNVVCIIDETKYYPYNYIFHCQKKSWKCWKSIWWYLLIQMKIINIINIIAKMDVLLQIQFIIRKLWCYTSICSKVHEEWHLFNDNRIKKAKNSTFYIFCFERLVYEWFASFNFFFYSL